VGKWHNGALDPLHHPCSRGFDEFVGFRGGWSDYYDWTLEANRRELRGDGRYLTDVLTEEAVSFLARHRAAPFYLQLAYSAPHVPLQAPEEEVAPYRAAADLSDEVATLYGMVTRLDRGIGEVLGALDALGLTDDTVVVLVSDNGPQFAIGAPTSTRRDLALQRFNLGWRGHKALVFEGGIRVPAVLRWPGGGLDGGRTVQAMTHFTDWVPTHLALAGLEPAAGPPLDGVDLTPLLRGEGEAHEGARFWQWTMYDPVATFNAAVRDGPWKLVRPAYLPEPLRFSDEDWQQSERYARSRAAPEGAPPPPPRFEFGPRPTAYLFDIEHDPGESTDLAATRPDVVVRLEASLDRWFEEVEAERRAGAGEGGG
jgi:arylsulfatase A-like enzyme